MMFALFKKVLKICVLLQVILSQLVFKLAIQTISTQ